MTERRDDWDHSEPRGHIQLLAQIEQPSLYIDTIALAPDGSSLAVAPLGLGIGIWNIETAIQYSVLEMPEDYLTYTLPDSKTIKEDGAAPVLVGMIAFSDDGAFVAAIIAYQEVGIWIHEGTLLETLQRPATGIAFLPKSRILILTLRTGEIEFWEILPARLLQSYPATFQQTDGFIEDFSCLDIIASSDGTQLASICSFSHERFNTLVNIWEIEQKNGGITLHFQRSIKKPSEIFGEGLYLPGSHHLFCSTFRRSLWGINTDTGETIIFLPGNIWPEPLTYGVSPDGKLVAVAHDDGKVVIRRVKDQRIIAQFQAHDDVKQEADIIRGLVWLPDGKRIVTVGTCRGGKELPSSSIKKQSAPSARYAAIRIWHVLQQ